MTESSRSSSASPKPPEELHWGIVYVREDIQDLRLEIRGLHGRIDESHRSLSERIDETNRSLSGRIDESHRSLGERIDAFNHSLSQRLEETNRRLDSRFTWMMTTMVALAGVIVAVIKL